MKNRKSDIQKILICFCAPLTVGILLMAVYFVHGVYPFGRNTVSYYDMSQSFVPLYYHTWDVLHGVKGIYFDWNIGMGCTLADVESSFLFFPSNIFFLFIKRESVLYAMSVFLLLKMMIAAFSMSYFVLKKYGNKYLCVYAGIAYAACGYILQYYTNIYYLDTVMIFPLLILSLDNLLREKKRLPYIFLLFLTFLTNQQMVFMVVIYIVFKGWSIVHGLEKDKRGQVIYELIICSVAGALLSSFAFIPSLLCMTQSVRFDNASSAGYFDIIKNILCDFPEQKYFMFFSGEIGVGAIIYVLLNGKKRIRQYADSLVMVFLLAAPIALDSIDLLWSGGSYMHFPMRFGYMLSFELIIITVRLANEIDGKESQKKYKEYLALGGIVLIPVSGVLMGVLCNKFRLHGIRDLSAYKGYGILFLVIVLIAVLMFFSERSKLIFYTFIVFALIQAACGMYGLIAPEGDFSLECGDGFVISANSVYENIEPMYETDRIKDRDILLNANYGLILDQSSLGCWMNGASPKLQSQMARMGYTVNYTRILDGCGTAFSDAVLGIRRLYGKEGMNSELYSGMTDVGEGYLYDCNYRLPFGFVMAEVADCEGYEYQNSLFSAATGLEEKMIEEIDISDATKGIFDEEQGVSIFDKRIQVDEKAVLYLYSKSSDDGKYSFAINECQVPLDAQGSEGNVMYTQFFLNGILELGTYENETVDLKILTELDSLANVHVGLMKLDTLQKGIDIINQNNSSVSEVKNGKLSLVLENINDGRLFIPIGYYDDYRVTLDGENKSYFPVLGDAFVGMDISRGKHTIEIEYVPRGLKIGFLLSALGAVMTIMLAFINRNKKQAERQNKILVIMYAVIICIMLIVLYIIPIIGAGIEIFSVASRLY